MPRLRFPLLPDSPPRQRLLLLLLAWRSPPVLSLTSVAMLPLGWRSWMMTRSRLTGWWRWSWVKWRVGHCSCSFSMKKRDERTTGQTGMI